MKKVLGKIFLFLWIGLLIFLHLGFYLVDGYRLICLGLIIFWFGVTIIFYDIQNKIEDKKKDKYVKKNVEILEFNHPKFGNIKLQHDIVTHKLSGEFEADFAGKMLSARINVDDNVDINKLLSNLNIYCYNANVVKERLYHELPSQNFSSGMVDEDGNEIALTEQLLRDKFDFNSFYIESADVISLWGSLNEDDYSINYDFINNKLTYELL